jgi:hypothetical protein
MDSDKGKRPEGGEEQGNYDIVGENARKEEQQTQQ